MSKARFKFLFCYLIFSVTLVKPFNLQGLNLYKFMILWYYITQRKRRKRRVLLYYSKRQKRTT